VRIGAHHVEGRGLYPDRGALFPRALPCTATQSGWRSATPRTSLRAAMLCATPIAPRLLPGGRCRRVGCLNSASGDTPRELVLTILLRTWLAGTRPRALGCKLSRAPASGEAKPCRRRCEITEVQSFVRSDVFESQRRPRSVYGTGPFDSQPVYGIFSGCRLPASPPPGTRCRDSLHQVPPWQSLRRREAKSSRRVGTEKGGEG
jgi:hypothetical protein